jgi:hypothetical protein
MYYWHEWARWEVDFILFLAGEWDAELKDIETNWQLKERPAKWGKSRKVERVGTVHAIGL